MGRIQKSFWWTFSQWPLSRSWLELFHSNYPHLQCLNLLDQMSQLRIAWDDIQWSIAPINLRLPWNRPAPSLKATLQWWPRCVYLNRKLFGEVYHFFPIFSSLTTRGPWARKGAAVGWNDLLRLPGRSSGMDLPTNHGSQTWNRPDALKSEIICSINNLWAGRKRLIGLLNTFTSWVTYFFCLRVKRC